MGKIRGKSRGAGRKKNGPLEEARTHTDGGDEETLAAGA
jgi:hypothetical protein